MIAFWVISALFVGGALLFVVPPLLAQRERIRLSRNATNLAIYRDQLHELDVDLSAGAIDKAHENARRELEARLLDDVADGDTASPPPRRGRGAVIAAALAIPLGALALYSIVGNPQALAWRPTADRESTAHGMTAQQVETLVARLAARMTQNPADSQGWILLARSYTALGRFAEASGAYTNAAARLPGDAQVLADLADALAMARGGRLQGEPEGHLARALEIDPRNLKALALAGTAAFDKQDYENAVRYWEQMLPLVPANSENARSIQASIGEARSLGATARNRGQTPAYKSE